MRSEICTPTEFASVAGRLTDMGASFLDGPSSALLQSNPAAQSAAATVAVVGADSCWTNSVRRPPKLLPVASLRHCSTLGPGRAKDRRRNVPAVNGQQTTAAATRLTICRDDLRFLQKLGEGRFAEVRTLTAGGLGACHCHKIIRFSSPIRCGVLAKLLGLHRDS